MSDAYDVVIVGGGLAGLTLSCLLGEAGLHVACLDQAPKGQIARKDHRTTAISFGSRKILETAGIWDKLKTQPCPIRDIKILDGDSPTLLRFISEEVEDKSFGWIVENTDFREAMIARVSELSGVKHVEGVRVCDFKVNDQSAAAVLADGTEISAALLVGADGRRSKMRDFMGVDVRNWSYEQRAVICTIAHTNPHDNIAVEHFMPDGPFAVLPMADDEKGLHRSSIVFTEHGPSSRSLMNYSDKDFEMALAVRLPDFYGDIRVLNQRMAYPLSLSHASEYIAPRMALVADAAHGIHPIAGQGLNLGFRDIKVLTDLLSEAKSGDADLGSDALLEGYQRQRRPDNVAMVAFTDGMNRLFSNNVFPLRAARRAGMRLVSKIGPAKRFFMHRAMGEK